MLKTPFRVLVFGFAALTALALVRSASFVGKPFPGFLVYPNGMVSAFGSDDWPGVQAGLDAWDLIEEVNLQPVGSAREILDVVRRQPAGSQFFYVFRRGGQKLSLTIPSREFTFRDFVREPLPWILTGIFVGFASLLVCYARPDPITFGFAAFGAAMGAALLRLDFLVGATGAYLLQPMLPLVPAALFHLALVFPERQAFLRRRPWLLAIPYGASLALGVVRAVFLFRAPEIWVRIDQLTFLYCGAASLFVVTMFVRGAFRGPDAVSRERARVVLWGLVPAVLSVLVGIAIRLLTGSRAAISLLPLFGIWLWIASLGYAAAKRNVFEFEILVRRTMAYTVVWAVTAGVYGVVLVLFYAVFRRLGYSNLALLPYLGAVFAVPFIPGLFETLRRRVEARVFPLRVRLVEIVGEVSEELSTLKVPADLARAVQQVFTGRVGVSHAFVYILGAEGFRCPDPAAPDPGPGGTPLFPKLERGEAVSIFAIARRGGPVFEWMRHHGFTLLLPLVARSRLEGVLVLGEPPGGRVFNSEDVDTLGALGSRIAISLANANAYDRIQDLEGRLRDENLALREQLELHPGFPEIIGRSPRMRSLFRIIEQVAGTETTVLLLGETGTGKELVARALHVRSPRRDGALVKVNCAAIPVGLIESELFGHERGAFTDAAARRRGKFELARHGTIFLDEIGELPLAVQAKLLRVLQEREYTRVGGTETLRADVRVIAASNRDLYAEVAAGRFREDLFFRLNVFPITLPPLRERAEDVPLLVEHFTTRLNSRLDKSVRGVTPESLQELERYSWPGNVRELENVIERAMVLGDGQWISVPPLESTAPERGRPRGAATRPLADVVRAAKVAAIDRALAAGGTQARAAEILGLKPPSLSRMLRDLGMRR